jgi:hypothetical protein
VNRDEKAFDAIATATGTARKSYSDNDDESYMECVREKNIFRSDDQLEGDNDLARMQLQEVTRCLRLSLALKWRWCVT